MTNFANISELTETKQFWEGLCEELKWNKGIISIFALSLHFNHFGYILHIIIFLYEY